MSADFLPYGKQEISDADVSVVAEALRDPLITQGPRVGRLEDAVRELTGAAHAVAFSSGTAALHAAAAALELEPGNEVIVPPITFAASANCIRYMGATPRFVDIDAATLNLDVEAAVAAARDDRVRAIVAVSFAGLAADVDGLREAGLPLIEDGCHALGGSRGGKPIGGPGGADLTAFSLHPVKAVTAGEGGILTCEDEELAQRGRLFREHGMVRSPAGADGPWSYDIQELGFNYRITDFQSALATSQLTRLRDWIEARNEIAALYRTQLADDSRILLPPAAERPSVHGYHLFPIQLTAGPKARLAVFEGLREASIGVQVHYIPIYRFSAYAGWPQNDCPNAERYYAGAISLPIFPAMDEGDVGRVVGELDRLLQLHA